MLDAEDEHAAKTRHLRPGCRGGEPAAVVTSMRYGRGMRRWGVVVVTAFICLSSCARAKTKATCGIGANCWECPSADAAMQCLSKLDGNAAGCKPTDPKNCK